MSDSRYPRHSSGAYGAVTGPLRRPYAKPEVQSVRATEDAKDDELYRLRTAALALLERLDHATCAGVATWPEIPALLAALGSA